MSNVPTLAEAVTTPAPGAPAASAPASPSSPASPPAAPAAPAAESQPAPIAARPDWAPEQYWDPQAGGLKHEDFGVHYAELADFKKQQTAFLASVPAEPAKYPIDLPKDFQGPEGFEFKLDPKDPFVVEAQQWAHENKLPAQAFTGLIGLKARMDAHEATQFATALAAQKKALGPDGPARIEAAGKALSALIGDDLAKTMIGTTFTAKQVMALEKIIQVVTNQGAAPLNTNGRNGHEGPPPPAQVPLHERMYGATTPERKVN